MGSWVKWLARLSHGMSREAPGVRTPRLLGSNKASGVGQGSKG